MKIHAFIVFWNNDDFYIRHAVLIVGIVFLPSLAQMVSDDLEVKEIRKNIQLWWYLMDKVIQFNAKL